MSARRAELWEELRGGLCPLLQLEVPAENTVVFRLSNSKKARRWRRAHPSAARELRKRAHKICVATKAVACFFIAAFLCCCAGSGLVVPAAAPPTMVAAERVSAKTQAKKFRPLYWDLNPAFQQVTQYNLYDPSSILVGTGGVPPFQVRRGRTYTLSAVNIRGESLGTPVVVP